MVLPIVLVVEKSRFRAVRAFLAIPPNVVRVVRLAVHRGSSLFGRWQVQKLKGTAEARAKKLMRMEAADELAWEDDEDSQKDDDSEDEGEVFPVHVALA